MKKIEKLSEQYLLKLTPSLVQLIDDAFSQYLKKTGKYISRAEFIRNILQAQCNKTLGKSNEE
jgi:hypothetical protein